MESNCWVGGREGARRDGGGVPSVEKLESRLVSSSSSSLKGSSSGGIGGIPSGGRKTAEGILVSG